MLSLLLVKPLRPTGAATVAAAPARGIAKQGQTLTAQKCKDTLVNILNQSFYIIGSFFYVLILLIHFYIFNLNISFINIS